MTSIQTHGIRTAHVLADGSLNLDGGSTTVVLSGLTPHVCDRLAEVVTELREQLLDGMDDVCDCDADDLPVFDHHRSCPRRMLAEYRGVGA